MATWEDGPEYAPLERPAEFTAPAVEPLDAASGVPEPVLMAASVPVERPVFTGPTQPVAGLETLVPLPTDPRDPQRPFAVAASTMTAGSAAWGSAHRGMSALAATLPVPVGLTPDPAFPAPFPGTPVPGTGYPSTGYPSVPLPVPYSPLAPAGAPPVAQAWPPAPPQPGSSYPPLAPGSYPAPGTPQWFGPATYGEQAPPGRVDARRVLETATPGVIICLVIGVLIYVMAPVLLVVAFVLSQRVKAAQVQVRRVLGIALGAVGFFALVGLARGPLGFSEWWGFVGHWSQVTCLAMLITVQLLVRRALQQNPPPPPSNYPNPWR